MSDWYWNNAPPTSVPKEIVSSATVLHDARGNKIYVRREIGYGAPMKKMPKNPYKQTRKSGRKK